MDLKSSAITLVVPTYNRADLISHTLRSALDQTTPFARIIVVDDGSTDETSNVLAGFSNEIVVIKTTNQGVQAARNTGVMAAESEMIALCDSDDLLEPDFVHEAMSWMIRSPQTDIFFTNFYLFDENGVAGNKYSQAPTEFFAESKKINDVYFEIPDLYSRTIKFQPFFPTGTVFRKKFFIDIGGYDVAFRGVGGEDWEFTLRALSLGAAAAHARPLAGVRRHSGNDSADLTHMNLGDAKILEHALLHHKGAARYRELILQSIDRRRLDAFNATFAAGQFERALDIEKMLLDAPSSAKFTLKKSLAKLPETIRRPLWLLTQGPDQSIKNRRSNIKHKVSVIEPTWDALAHLPGNLGLLRVVCGAYPNADISYVGGAAQIALLKDIAPPDLIARVQFVAWVPCADADTLPTDVRATRQKLLALPPQLTKQASLLVLCSCTATVLTALCWMGLANKSVTMLHGNANELDGWRSRNPFRSLFDLTGALKRFCRQGGKVTVMEDRICQQLGAQNPWLQKSLLVIPHPLLPEEARPNGDHKQLNWPIKIGFAGLATIAKGFPDFLELARQTQSQHPGQFEFHAFGKLTNESFGFDQSPLTTRAKDALTRSEFVTGLNSLHYLFIWHQDNYYSNAASGVVYDAINLGIPMIARRCAQISEWADQGVDVANSFEDLPSAIQTMSKIDIAQAAPHYKAQCAGLDQLRDSLSLPILSKIFVQHFPL